MKISVIIPTYKPDYTLYECLNSLSRQTLSIDEFEVVLILNGEQNPYEQDIQNYLSNSPLKVQYIYSSEKGVSNARNIGIEHASGDYITFVDSDDWVSENYLSGLLEKTNNSQMALADVKCFDVETNTYFADYLGKRYESLCSDILYPHLKIRSYFSTPVGKLIPFESCQQARFSTKYDFGEDGLYMFSIEPYLPLGGKAEEDVIYYRRCVPGSLSRKRRRKMAVLFNQFGLLLDYWKIYLKGITRYNVIFFIFRNLAILSHFLK